MGHDLRLCWAQSMHCITIIVVKTRLKDGAVWLWNLAFWNLVTKRAGSSQVAFHRSHCKPLELHRASTVLPLPTRISTSTQGTMALANKMSLKSGVARTAVRNPGPRGVARGWLGQVPVGSRLPPMQRAPRGRAPPQWDIAAMLAWDARPFGRPARPTGAAGSERRPP